MNDGATPFFRASQFDHVEVVKLLCDTGATTDYAKCDGAMLLSAASYHGHVEVMELRWDADATNYHAKRRMKHT